MHIGSDYTNKLWQSNTYFFGSLNVPGRPRGRLCEESKFVDSTTAATANHKCTCMHAGAHACVCVWGRQVNVAVGKLQFWLKLRVFVIGRNAKSLGLFSKSHVSGCLQYSDVYHLSTSGACGLQGPKHVRIKMCTAFPPFCGRKKNWISDVKSSSSVVGCRE